MKKTPSPSLQQSNQRRKSVGLQDRGAGNGRQSHNVEKHSALTHFKSSVKKFFTLVLSGKRNTASEAVESDDKKNTHKVRGVSSSADLSSDSSKSSSKWMFSHSSASSGTLSSQLGMGNFTFEEIYKATAKFSPENKIGEGAFGTVYKGKLYDGTLVAVKRAKKDLQNKNLAEFKNEINTLSKIEHMNLVRWYGYLEHGDEKIIVVEYVNNGTLREHLDGFRGNGLEIGERLDIAIDVAHAITYLHMYTDHPIIHRDIKASNILITDKLRAKVADFGFARLGAEDPGATHISTQIKGTAGYIDPDYMRTQHLSEKSDVYSFGVLLVEMMTGRHPVEPKRPPSERVTIKWAMQMLKQGEIVIAMDPRLRRNPASNKAVQKVLKLAFQCLAPVRRLRPSMKSCAEVLWDIRKDFREKASSHRPRGSHHSANFPQRDARKNRHMTVGIEDGEGLLGAFSVMNMATSAITALEMVMELIQRDHNLLDRMVELLNPTCLPVYVREGNEPDIFWDALWGKAKYPRGKEIQGFIDDPHLFALEKHPFKKGEMAGTACLIDGSVSRAHLLEFQIRRLQGILLLQFETVHVTCNK
ncbi:Calmodulin-binding receptor cytoplasmic kinase 1 [Spatholobus suberectus]|nr:Calmodulin-binding receptor cytoplasmic kinase 1 [Spatholobus suberectus]